MRFAGMRRVAGLVFAGVWSVVRLAQPLQPQCPHHAATVAAEASAATTGANADVDPHAAHAAHSIQHDALSTTPQGSPDAPASTVPCDCAAHCCAASTIAAPAPAALAVVPASMARAPKLIAWTSARPAIIAPAHRQPPATAPPATITT